MTDHSANYSNLLDKAKKITTAGCIIQNVNVVYYECRDPLRFNQTNENNQRFYKGKINGQFAHCVTVDPSEKSNLALFARIIWFICSEKPNDSSVFRRTGKHRGKNGLLKERVTCGILRKFENIPDR